MRTFLSMMVPGWLAVLSYVVSGETRVNLTTTLGVLTGVVINDPGRPHVHVFYGIPYAVPPIGSLRFKPPEQAISWTGTRDASRMPSSCWQMVDMHFGRRPQVEMWNPNTNMSEDCLYVNAWVPSTSTRKAIMVWIYGGGFWSGTSTLSVYNALKLASRNDIIVASFNYRVGPFGLLYGGTADSPGNVGLLDQVMALKWIQDNAVNMGGDPHKITLFGESAGAASVGFHLMSPLSMNLFTYAILMSGSPNAHWTIQPHDVALNRTRALASLLGCTSGDMNETVSFLRTMNPQLLADKQWDFKLEYFEPPFGPVVDRHFLPKHPTKLMEDGMMKNTSIITGVVKDEGTYWLLYGIPQVFNFTEPYKMNFSQYTNVVDALLRAMGPNFTADAVREFTMKEYYDSVPPWSRNYLDTMDDISGDTLFKCPVISFSEYYSSRVKAHVYMYSFEHRLSTNSWPLWLGVAHGYEIEVFFGLPWFHEEYTDEERYLSDDVMIRISNFAKTGNPNSGSRKLAVKWPPYTSKDQHYLIMRADKMHSSQSLRFSQCQFWEGQVPLLQDQATASTRKQCANSAERLPSWRHLVTLLALVNVVAFTNYHSCLTIS